jgi:hypothetical protein
MKTKFTSDRIWRTYERNLSLAGRRLKGIPVYCGGEPKFRGLSGWVFEQAIQHCIQRELRALGVRAAISEQFKFGSRAKADLQIGKVLVEIKLSGFFSREACAKYGGYRKAAARKGFSYLLFSGEETYQPNRKLARKVFGRGNTFFLDTTADWRRFIRRLVALLKKERTKAGKG